MVVERASWREMYKGRKDGQGAEEETLFSSRREKGTSVQGHFSSRAQSEQRPRGGKYIQGHSKWPDMTRELNPYQREAWRKARESSRGRIM